VWRRQTVEQFAVIFKCPSIGSWLTQTNHDC
jgi:hypothetical protein